MWTAGKCQKHARQFVSRTSGAELKETNLPSREIYKRKQQQQK
jgi:hypothetical protein